ncbi:hypothetical protein [Palleronia marisminoris]|uniref:hypothetical protein n=1 Tax=Palleronia marisminoris TaxID=315423 RepID=UPI000A2708D8|nr:hypothetical protein [Palleronia marisminoris]
MDKAAFTAALDAASVGSETKFSPRRWPKLPDPFPKWRKSSLKHTCPPGETKDRRSFNDRLSRCSLLVNPEQQIFGLAAAHRPEGDKCICQAQASDGIPCPSGDVTVHVDQHVQNARYAEGRKT